MRKLILGVLILLLFSCSQPEHKKASTPNYFDVEGYFNKEINRLQTKKPNLLKTVLVKDSSESKTVKIKDWKRELAIFSSADINKESWRSEFSTSTSENLTTYLTSNPKIPVKRVEVLKQDDKVVAIKIYRLSENYLYRSTDTLYYYPDSLYQIKSEQKIKLLSLRNYQVTGRFEY